MDLGQGIRKALARVTGAALVDEATVKELSKDIQRALLANDVNVKLVLELTKRIERRTLQEKLPAGLSLREHATRVVYEELTAMMGEKFEPELTPRKIMLIGLFGSGKCVHPDTLIPLTSGETATAESLWDKRGKIEELPGEGWVKELEEPLEVTSFDQKTLKVVKGRATHVWKMQKTAPLMRVHIRNGNAHAVTVTPEHPFFILENGAVLQARADELRLGQYIAVPRKILFDGTPGLKNKVLENMPDYWLIHDAALASRVKQAIRTKGTLKKTLAESGIKANYCAVSGHLKRGWVYVGLLKAAGIKLTDWPQEAITVRRKGAQYAMKLPLVLDEGLAELLGYFIADGNLDAAGMHITNESPEINARLPELAHKLFGLPTIAVKSKRSQRLFKTSINSATMVGYLETAFGFKTGRKSSTVRLPEELLNAPDNIARIFLRAYFDCDGYATAGARGVEFCTASKGFANDLRMLLLKDEMHSTLSRKTVNGTSYYRLMLKGSDAERFAFNVSSALQFKRERLYEGIKIGERQTRGIHENIPAGKLLHEARESSGATIGEVQDHVRSYGIYEKEGVISRNSLSRPVACVPRLRHDNKSLLKAADAGVNAHELYKKIGCAPGTSSAMAYRLCQLGLLTRTNDEFRTTTQGQEYILKEKTGFNQLELLAHSDVLWLPVTRVELAESSEYVYDLTVEEHHNFVANGVFVHNTTSISKLAKFYQSRGLSVGVIAGDVHRPAAFEQLEQLAKQVGCDFYGERNAPAEKVAREGLARLASRQVIILDTAGRSGFDAELANELKRMNEVFKPDDKYLVVSADIGQVAGRQAEAFRDAVGITGVIVTKMDGSGKGGGALSAVHASGAKIAFLGTGEKPDALEVFDAKKFVARLCGFPDLEQLLEKVKGMSDEAALQDALAEGKLDYNTFMAQMRAMKKMGPLKGIFQMMGAYDLPEDVIGQSERKMKQFEALVNSMTPDERIKPDLMKNAKRQERVARGAGVSAKEVKELVSNFEKSSKLVKGLRGNRGMMKKLGKMLPPGLKM